MNPNHLQSPEQMLERWQRVVCSCDRRFGWLCESCHDTQVLRDLLRERNALKEAVRLAECQPKPVEKLPQAEPRENLPSKAVQIQAASLPGDSNSGPHVQLFALCGDGSIWVQYASSGFSNVPTDGRWYPVGT